MQQVVARRDDNWKKLQQYVLDEREELDLRGPGNIRMWGEQREYTWFIRDGFFVRSPVKFNGVTIGEDERRKAEDEYLRRVQRRDARGRQAGPENADPDSAGIGAVARPDNNDAGADAPTASTACSGRCVSRSSSRRRTSSGSSSTRAPTRSSAANSSRAATSCASSTTRRSCFQTPAGQNAPGRARRPRPRSKEDQEKDKRQEEVFRRVLNKVALITLWIEPTSHQIVKYTFDNIDFDFLPGQWLVHVDTAKASMTMGQPFQDVWLPRGIDVNVGVTLANGKFTFRETVTYHDYREATVTSKVGVPGASGGAGKR